jgi:hypothetical protein
LTAQAAIEQHRAIRIRIECTQDILGVVKSVGGLWRARRPARALPADLGET